MSITRKVARGAQRRERIQRRFMKDVEPTVAVNKYASRAERNAAKRVRRAGR